MTYTRKERRSHKPEPYTGEERRDDPYGYIIKLLGESRMKSNGSGIKAWVLNGVLSFLIVVIVGVGGYLLADANDTLKNAATRDDVDRAIVLQTVPREEISDMIHIQTAPDKVELQNVVDDIKEIKGDFRDFKEKQEEKFKEFSDNQEDIMQLLINVNAKLENQ